MATEYTSWNDTPTITYAQEGDIFTALSTGKKYVFKNGKWTSDEPVAATVEAPAEVPAPMPKPAKKRKKKE